MASSSNFQKPENALKRCEELIAVGQKNNALDILEAVIKFKRKQWSQSLEPVMLKFLDLCVETKQGKRVKDVLIQYRYITNTQPQSLEVVVRHFLDLTEKAAGSAQAKFDTMSLEAVEDLESQETPDGLLLASLRGEETGDRAEKEGATQWLRFQWEAYRSVLEVSKNNSKLEDIYSEAAKGALNFCLKYKRKSEFRRVADMLRLHLAGMNKANALNMSSLLVPETMQQYLDIRFLLLKTACDLELWQEAFRSAEDLYNLLQLSKRPPKGSQLITFYSKLAQIFWVSENYLFHACALYKLFTLSRNPKNNVPAETQTELCSQLLLAALSIPPEVKKTAHAFELDVIQKQKNLRMAQLLGFAKVPKRENLIAELVGKGISGIVVPEFRALYETVEVEFHPLDMADKLKPVFAFLTAKDAFTKYLRPLQNTVLLRLLRQLSSLYSVMQIEAFTRLADFLSFHDCEKFIVESVSKGHVFLKIDHKNKTLNFATIESDSEKMRQQLATFASKLQTAANLLSPCKVDAERKQAKAERFAQIRSSLQSENKYILNRKVEIEKRKEIAEVAERRRIEEEKAKHFQEKKHIEQTESERVKAETQQREAQQKEREREQKEEEEKRLILQQVAKLKAKKTGEEKKIDDEELEKLKDVNRKDLIEQKKQELEKEKKEFAEKMTALATRLDHLERARREEESPLLKQNYLEQKEKLRKDYEEEVALNLANAKKAHEQDIQDKQRLLRVDADRKSYIAQLRVRREKEFEVLKVQHAEKLAKERAKREAEIAAKKAKEEERKKREAEEAEARRAEEEKRRAEEKERAAAAAPAETASAPSAGAWRANREAAPPAESGGGWRANRDAAPPAEGGGGWRANRDAPPREEPSRDRDAPREGGSRFGSGGGSASGGWKSGAGNRDEAPREGGRSFGGDRDAPRGGFGDRDREGGSRFGGDRDGPRSGGFGGDRDREGGRGGGFGGDRDREGGRGFGGDRDGPRGGGFGGDRDREGGSRFGGGGGASGSWRNAGGNRDEPPRSGPDSRGPPRNEDDGFQPVSRRK